MSDIVVGPLVDVWCWESNNGIALDTGADLTQDPGAHSVHSLYEVDFCRNSGFIIVGNHPDGDRPYQAQSTLDKKGNLMVVKALRDIHPDSTDCYAIATGTVSEEMGIDQSPVLITKDVTLLCEDPEPVPMGNGATSHMYPHGLSLILIIVSFICSLP